jgi:hypothetical protein
VKHKRAMRVYAICGAKIKENEDNLLEHWWRNVTCPDCQKLRGPTVAIKQPKALVTLMSQWDLITGWPRLVLKKNTNEFITWEAPDELIPPVGEHKIFVEAAAVLPKLSRAQAVEKEFKSLNRKIHALSKLLIETETHHQGYHSPIGTKIRRTLMDYGIPLKRNEHGRD